jgi:hypothetical protein
MADRLEGAWVQGPGLPLRIRRVVNPNRLKEISMTYESPVLIEVIEYEKPVLLDLEEVVAGCNGCLTGGTAPN